MEMENGMQPKKEVLQAMNFAKDYHKGQYRMGSEGQIPYYDEHILGVYNILKDECHVTDSEILITALLHDTVEDTECTFEDIEGCFGNRIMNNVKLLTRIKGELFSDYTERLFAGASEKVVLVKLADRLHNLRTILYMPDKKWIEKKVRQTRTDILNRLDIFPLENADESCCNNILMLKEQIKNQLKYIDNELLKRV